MKSLEEITEALQNLNIIRHIIRDDGTFPNNGLLPLVVYKGAIKLDDDFSASEKIVKDLFESNNWSNAWTNGVLDVHHYHSTTHEVLGIIRGTARIQFGGDKGISIEADKGDVIIIPAGVAHKKHESDENFSCVGAYPDGRDYDMNYGKEGERPFTDHNIINLPKPDTDPVYGTDGPLVKNWTT
jgi:uncharacterized protein YjlB